MELIADNASTPGESLVWLLKNRRPKLAPKKSKKAGQTDENIFAPQKQRTAPRKSLLDREIRDLIHYFRGRGDDFCSWIAGYL